MSKTMKHTKGMIPVSETLHDIVIHKKMDNPYDEYLLDKMRKRDATEVLERAAERQRARRIRQPQRQRLECALHPLVRDCVDKMRQHAEGLRVHGLLPDWERAILSWIPARLRHKYPAMLEAHLNEAKARYLEIMRATCLRCVLSGDDYEAADLPYKRRGRTRGYDKFLRRRRAIAQKYYLSHKIARAIVARAATRLPQLICDFHKYRAAGYLEFPRFVELVKAELDRGALTIAVSYHGHIVKLIGGEPARAWQASAGLSRCCGRLLALQIIDRMRATMENLLDAMSQPRFLSPLLALSLKCENNDLFVSPPMCEIRATFHSFLDTIAQSAQQLPSVESLVKLKSGSEGQSAAQMPDWYLIECHRRLNIILDKAFDPLTKHVDAVRRKFQMVYNVDMQKTLVKKIVENKDFDTCLEKLEEFNESVVDVHGMTKNEYFSNCILYQEEAKNGLKTYMDEVRKLIINELVARHKNFNLAICSEFETIVEKALNIPEETEKLLELGRYMLHVQTIVLEQLRDKITESINMLTSLFEMTSLNKTHVELNNATFNWLQNIKPILEKNSALYEQKKFELEERLQNRIINLNKRVEDMFPRLALMDDMDDASRIAEYIEFMRKFALDLERMSADVEWINREEGYFQFPRSVYPRIQELKEQAIIPFYELIAKAYRWQRYVAVWLDGPFEYLDSGVVDSKTTEYFQEFSKSSKTFRMKIKMQISMNYPYTFTGSVDDPDYHQQPAPMKLCHQLLDNVKWFKQYVPLVLCFCNPALRQRHWDEMSEVAGFDLTPNAGTTLRKIIEMNLMNNLDLYEQISVGATKELGLQELLEKMETEWSDIYFTTMPFKDSKVSILTQLDDIQALLEEHIVKVQAMRGSAFVKPIAEKVKIFYELLLRVQKTLDEWTKVQVQWMYLLPIFSSKDIVAQLPEEGILFTEVDGTFRKAMQSVAREPRVRETAGSVGLYEAMRDANEMMEKVNDGVANYLEKKRLFFPRFFFLSNDDMLEILSETKDPLRVQPHLKKCFEGIAKLGFNEKLDIYSIISDDREEINIVETISTEAARGCVERWLVQVEEQMVSSVRQEVLMSYRDYEVNRRVDWVKTWPGMVVLCVSQIYWSIQVQATLMTHMESAMKTLYQKLRGQIIDMVNLVKGQLSKQNRTTLNALITIDVHAQDVVKSLLDSKIVNETDFEWLAQLRYYWEDDVIVRIINTSVAYAYEYLGNCPRLVITPLTDRCYRTLIGAYSLHLNGAPEGPAGTGKTETTKDLARALAVQCVVFNCSEGLDYKNMGKFFKGLASCGAWACFDEFNRIELEVLSVVAQQILCIVQAVRGKLETFIFEGTELKLNPAVYVCITMNPGYAGRSELPDNLKVLFRTVAMMVPDYAMIGEIFLYSSGFTSARILAIKIVTTYKLCSEQLSSQSHYDYGMRAVKTVLTAAQNIKLRFPDGDETILLLRSIVDVNLPKFLAHDVPLFKGIISDLFPGVDLPSPNYDVLLKAVDEVAKKRNLQTTDGFILKIIQTFEMMLVRHGFMLVGDPCGGKTTILHTLADALTLMSEWGDEHGAVTKFITMNPKSITMGQLYGQFDPVSSEWTDGVCAVAFRKFCSEESADRKWLIFDGPVDAVWIENLNTVLDDNKKLCLTSGEVMQMTNVMSMIFEVMDLLQASPATVSRCGMIYIEPHILGWRPSVTSWVNSSNPVWRENHETTINLLIDLYFESCLEFTKRQCTLTLTAGQINQVTSTLNLIEMFMNDAVQENADTPDMNQNIDFWLQAAFLLALVWGIGGTLDVTSREKYNNFITTIWKNENPDHPVPEELNETISLPSDGLIHDNFYVFKGKGTWKFFFEIVKAEPIIETQSVGQMLIPTMDTVKYQYIFQRHIKHKKRFLLFGKTGTGKSFYIQDLIINKLNNEDFLPNFITFTARTTAAQTQDLVISKLFKRRKGHYGPMKNVQCLCFIDDVNMPAKEIYGAQPPIELLRQFFDHEYWYDLKEPEIVKIYDTMFICAMAPPGGSRQEIYPRFLRHFNLYEICEFSNDSIFRIFSNVALFGLKRRGFASDINTIVNCIINATMAIFEGARAELRPTPAKSHYLFNLRDFARVITGCTMIRKESAETKDTFVRLWTHEVLRVFGDRLIDSTDSKWLFYRIKETVEKTFRESFDGIFVDLPKYNEKLTEESFQHLIFGNFMDTDALGEDRKYEEIKSIEEYKHIALLCLEEYNTTHKHKMDIVFFHYALIHLARVCRVLAIPTGSLLMVGIGGSGRQSLTKLAAGMTNCGLFQPEIGSAYGINEWRDDIKKVLKIAGSGKDIVFLFTENQIKDESFLADIDSLLNSGEVPNLYNVEERQEVVEMTRLAAQGGNRNLDISVLSVLRFFVNRCKEKLHVMLCFSPIGESFRTRLRMYPSLVNCCTIDWFQVWPEDALEQVALRSTTNINVDDEIKVNSVTACKYFHACAKEMSDRFYQTLGRKTYVTSAAFLDLIRAFGILMKEKQEEVILARDRYIGGLEKLEFAAEQVSKMKLTLTTLQPELEESAKLTALTMKKIKTENISVEKATKTVKQEEDAANKQAEIAGALKAECEADLAEALPVLEEAIAALNTLKPADITLVKSMKNPPEGVKLVMAAVCVMMGVPPDRVNDPSTGRKILDYWGPSKRILSDMKFLDYLRDYDKDNIDTNTMQTIEKVYLTDKNFEPSKVAKASQAAEGLCKWVRAMVLYDRVIKIVKPKKEKLAEAEATFQKTMNFLNEKRQMLAELNAKLEALNEQLAHTLEKKLDLENQVTLCRNKLIRAEKLINGLGGEKNRWTECAANLQRTYDRLPGDVLISCGMIAYLGPYMSNYRLENLAKWTKYVGQLKIPRSDDYSFVGVLGSEIKINFWNIYGLPRDSFSIENAIIMDNTKRWSLFIDPQSQANLWIRSMEKANQLEIVKLTDSGYMNIVEQCIEHGKPVLIENIGEELDAPLDPILAKNIYKVAGIWYITLGEKSLEYDIKFRLYITTKLRNPHYLPEVFNKVTLINFALTIEGLEDQLLGIVVAKERPDLQEKREYLIVQSAANKKALKQVEDEILKTLSTAGASILEDEEAIEILDSSKILSLDIQRKQEAAKETQVKIEAFRQSYKPIAKHSAALYYTITDLPNIDPMYQYSLGWFINLYVLSIETANKSNVLERRLGFLRQTFTYNLYQNICRSLFEKDKVLYSFILCTTIMQASGEVSRDEMSFFLTGGLVLPASAALNPAPDWLSDKSWDEIKRSANLPVFARLPGDFATAAARWKLFYDAVNPENAPLPEPWEVQLSDFQKLIVMRMIRPDKVIPKVMQFVRNSMGDRYVTPPAFDIARSYADSNCLIPLIFILSPGSDPMGALTKFAEQSGYLDRFFSISLGQGQGPIARGLIQQAQEDGCWVCLQNCHLAVSWMPELEKICESFDLTNTSMNFRLWLTSYPSDKFPIAVLQNGVKMTNEPPSGLQQNLMRSYTSEPVKNPEFFAGCPGKERTFTRLLYGLCFFHAVVQERRNYGAQGWNIRYGFNESDFQISAQQLQIFINDYDEVPFKAILYLTGECNYGGRVTDDRDRRCLNTILLDFYNVDVIKNPEYTFSGGGREYSLPKKCEYEYYIKQIESIPLHPSPEVLGLNMNAGITRDLDISKTFFDSLGCMQGGVSIGDAAKQDELLLNMKTDIYERLPELFDLELAQKLHPASYTESMNTVLVQEMERFNVLLREMRVSLAMLERAVQGLIVMTPDLETMAAHMLAGKIPPSWRRASAYPSLKPLASFVNDFLERLAFFRHWMEHGKPPTFWISGFSFVHAFLTGAAQNYARKYKISIDLIDFDFEVLPRFESQEGPEDGVYVYGMHLSGARWDLMHSRLAEARPKLLHEPMPLVWLRPRPRAEIQPRGRYLCPLYITSERFGTLKTTGHSTNYVLSILLDTQLPPAHWVKRGVALLCQLDD